MSFYNSLSPTEKATVHLLVAAGYGRGRLASALSRELGRPVSKHQARTIIEEVRQADPTIGAAGDPSAAAAAAAVGAQPGMPLGPATFERVGDEARVVSAMVNPKTVDLNADEDEEWLIAEVFGLDPQAWEIVEGTLRIRSDPPSVRNPDGDLRRQYGARLRHRRGGFMSNQEFAELVAARPRTSTGTDTGTDTDTGTGSATDSTVDDGVTTIDATQVICVADLQVGKKESGGAHGFRRRWTTALVNLERHLGELRVLRRLPRKALIVGLGDLIEQCVAEGQGLTNTPFACDLTTSQQMEMALRLLDELVDMATDNFEAVHLVAVPGNHGERRSGSGRAYTDSVDNYDLDLFRQLEFAYSKNPERYAHVSFTLSDGLSVVTDASGTTLAIAHGHRKIRGGSRTSLDAKAVQYWEKAAFNRGFNPGFHAADVFLTGHYHHLRVADVGGNRLWIQAPAMEGSDSSAWYGEMGGGVGSTQGLLTFATSQGRIWSLTIAQAEENGVIG